MLDYAIDMLMALLSAAFLRAFLPFFAITLFTPIIL